ncbi:MAG: YjbF family lipoprotein [Cypionkella sp.]|uniref:YjbF family lipoprotein n=1 Tax=Cypionkella sp. TaxID=2811411 RepID=UPI002ABA3DE4|nr:YjbF family lipoprotein [Cypionkella sp.]MDZ4309642.1 YjbF family lipoprotein [Cypionkella sp.]
MDTAPNQMARLAAVGAPAAGIWMLTTDVASRLLAEGMRDGVTRWRSLENTQIYTRDGMIIGTRGLGFDLITADPGDAVKLILTAGTGQTIRIHRVLDGEDRLVIRAFVCDIAPVGIETIYKDAAGNPVQALRVDEICHGPSGNFRNHHWLRNSRIDQTIQFVGPEIGRIQLRFLP